jgi:hypothetical protein
MREVIERAIRYGHQFGATYFDARVVEHQAESLSVKNGVPWLPPPPTGRRGSASASGRRAWGLPRARI